MIQKIILAPFNFIFKIISFVLSNFWYGFLVLCYLVYYVVSSFFRTITFPIRYILKKKKNSEKNLLKQEKHRKEKLSKLQKTLGIVNQAIPMVKQVSPILNNAKTMFKIMNEFKKVDTPISNNTESVVKENNEFNEESKDRKSTRLNSSHT